MYVSRCSGVHRVTAICACHCTTVSRSDELCSRFSCIHGYRPHARSSLSSSPRTWSRSVQSRQLTSESSSRTCVPTSTHSQSNTAFHSSDRTFQLPSATSPHSKPHSTLRSPIPPIQPTRAIHTPLRLLANILSAKLTPHLPLDDIIPTAPAIYHSDDPQRQRNSQEPH